MPRAYTRWDDARDETLRRLYIDERLPVADLAERLEVTQRAAKSRVAALALRRTEFPDDWMPQGGRVSVTKERVRCLGTRYGEDEEHWFFSPDRCAVRICPRCRKRDSYNHGGGEA